MGRIYLLLISMCFIICSTLANDVRVEFNMKDRQVTEGEGNCDVLLLKKGTPTQDINVRVRALTVEQYNQLTGKSFDEVYPSAEVDDFVAYDEVFTFQQGEKSNQQREIEVEIVDDLINEAAEEFLLFFDIIDSVSIVDEILTSDERNPIRCRIMNNDALRIGLESGSYTVPEMSSLEDLVYLTKQDGTTIDQDIEIELRTTGRAGATLGNDYTTPNGQREFTITFPATETRIGVPINILEDDETEEDGENIVLQFEIKLPTGVTLISTDITSAIIYIEDITPPPPPPVEPSSVPVPTSTPLPSPPAPTSTPLVLPSPMATVIDPVSTPALQQTNIPQEGGDPPCNDKNDDDLGLAIGLTFLITFLVTALCAIIIIIFVVIADRKRRERHAEQEHS